MAWNRGTVQFYVQFQGVRQEKSIVNRGFSKLPLLSNTCQFETELFKSKVSTFSGALDHGWVVRRCRQCFSLENEYFTSDEKCKKNSFWHPKKQAPFFLTHSKTNNLFQTNVLVALKRLYYAKTFVNIPLELVRKKSFTTG